ncbi:hypothetical protein EHQ12_04510 [Leptospira gomenensis]|uniref:Uncharacterized protein n=1 Tax=Leptospira gomenensis TaxID=2484974 RepID=A0A5F1YS67_9LEPT|nr:hypothetical protein [Leptospira gomenensis]TGK38638.1 hypothetical protein EHQ17_00940 [Leptospira gomenensis]TGK42875.1 hypothetical protein EHQ12_04510 [Leptospira gomenensis]TGK49580.1 hypothetical protein EHQ07_04665 [Leptospira gomenensis]TGK60750.1 hypothetical protein EHQ13_10405 [Leptospira gomenensis]
MKRILPFAVAILLFAQSVFALSEIELLLIQEATNPELKKIAKEYLNKKAKDQRALAEKYQSLADRSQGGKANNSNEEHKKYKKLADHCNVEAQRYEEEAGKL